MGEESIMPLSANQKDKIYRDMLVPLKNKISQILLYDTKAAVEFLQSYNEIIENEQQAVGDILKAINNLELRIGEYENSSGKEKAFEERSQAVLQIIEDLKINSIQLSLEEFENKFAELKRNYEGNIQNYSFKDRERIDRGFYALQASLIMRQVASGRTSEELQQTITEQDKVGLNMFVSEQINSLKQREDFKDVASKVSNIVMTDNDAVLRSELWSWMNAAERGRKVEEKSQVNQLTTSTAMMVTPKKRNNTLWGRILRMFSKEPMFPLQTSDLKKISIDWLSKYIPKPMLMELENQRLSKEKMQVDSKYVPDPKTVIYEMFKEDKKFEKEMKIQSERKIKEYNLYNENNERLTIVIINFENRPYIGTHIIAESAEYSKKAEYLQLEPPVTLLEFAGLLDKTFNTDFQQQLLQELKDVYIDQVSRKKIIYNSLLHCWNNLKEECEKTILDFGVKEEAKRKKFYNNNRFKEQIKQQGTDDGTRMEIQAIDETIIQHRENNEEGQEQGGE